jgi:nitrogen regulatory protein PII
VAKGLSQATTGSRLAKDADEATLSMKTLMIVARDSMVSELKKLLHDNGVNAYSLLNKVEGRGKTGKVHESYQYPGFNLMFLAVLSSNQVDRVVSALKAFHAVRLQAAGGQAIPLKLFSFPCEELI